MAGTFIVRGAASNDLNDQRKTGKRVALLGDSITDYNFDLGSYPATAAYRARGYFTWANILLRQRFTLVSPSTTDGAWGAPGQTAAQLITNGEAAGAAASSADIVIVLAGTNDLTDAANYTAAQISQNLQSIWNIQLAAGKQVIAATIWPRNNSDSSAVVQKLRDTNRLIRSRAASTPGVILCDWYGSLLNASTSLANSSAYFIDGVHPNATGGSRTGAALAATLDRLAPPGNDDLALDAGDNANFLGSAALMQGTGGAGSGGPTGTYATGWTCYGDANSVGSKISRTDLWPGEWQQIAISNNATSSFTFQSYSGIGSAGQPAIGDNIYATVEFETDATNWAGSAIGLEVQFNGSSNIARGPGYDEYSTLWRPASGIIRTPNIPVPSGATLVKLNIVGRGTGTYRFGRAQLVKA